MITFSGKSVWPEDSVYYDASQVPTLEDIGVGLSRIMRFAGQTRKAYSVLLHSFVVGELVDPKYKLHGLVHDASEAIVSDTPSTWKTARHKNNEEHLMMLITCEHFPEILTPWNTAAYDAVKEADYIALAAEAHVLGHLEAEKWWPRKNCEKTYGIRFMEALALTEELYPSTAYYMLSPEVAAAKYTSAVTVAYEDLKLLHV